MSKADILIKLRELHEELSTINDDLLNEDKVDEETIDALGEIVTDVSRLIDVARENMGLSDNDEILDRILQFQSDHPTVTRFLSQVTDMLAMIGI